jgi:hypothetical protein
MTVSSLPDSRLLEVVSLRPDVSLPQGWPTRPGAVHRDASGIPAVLHHAPSRWLVFPVDAEVRAWVESAGAQGCVVADVSGKWRGYLLVDAARSLASGGDIEALLRERDCAAVALFDCPVIIAKCAPDYLIWVQRSFSAAFREGLSAAAQ